jgi:osmotically inducible protein OsmC
MNRKATAVWTGDLKSGKGTMTAPSGVMTNAAYSFATRFENTPGTNPEELIAAAHAGCFSMATSGELGKAGMVPERLETTAVVARYGGGQATITESHLVLKAKIPGADRAKFDAAVNAAKAGCPISRLLNTKITLEATLES